MRSAAEENYLKAIYKLEGESNLPVPTGALAQAFGIQAPSVTDMIKKLAEKKLVSYEKSRGVTLSAAGRQVALAIIRKHRIWETFLVQTLKFGWDQVHEIAEQLEHVKSEELTDRLEEFLAFPKFDPHGDPIPDKNGLIQEKRTMILKDAPDREIYILTGLAEDSSDLMQYLDKMGINLGTSICILSREPFDQSLQVQINGKEPQYISAQVASNLLVTETV